MEDGKFGIAEGKLACLSVQEEAAQRISTSNGSLAIFSGSARTWLFDVVHRLTAAADLGKQMVGERTTAFHATETGRLALGYDRNGARIAVGMPITGHPPHRSGQARFEHPAPTLGV